MIQLGLPFLRADPTTEPGPPTQLRWGGEPARLDFVRMRRAKRYIIRVRPDGSIRVTIPRGGSRREAESFFAEHRRWAERERRRVLTQHAPGRWLEGDEILLRGELVPILVERDNQGYWVIVGGTRARLRDRGGDLRPAAEECLRAIAKAELIPRLHQLARVHGLEVSCATIRSQRSRWGSCSPQGAVALNFRLVQAPASVCEYVLIHELMHIRQHNHSRRFWRLVSAACPGFRDAERWLRSEGRSLF